MSTFERGAYSPTQSSAEELKQAVPARVTAQLDYAPFTDIDTGVTNYPAEVTMAGLDKALGSQITRLLLLTDAETTLHVGAQVLANHAASPAKSKALDLQANLLVNVVKEISQIDEEVAIHQRPQFCEDILRRCSLEVEFKQKLKQELFVNQVVHAYHLTTIHMDR